MKAVRFHEYGPPEVLVYEEVTSPRPGPGEAVVRVHAVGVNHVDLDMRSGVSRYPLPLPHTLGREFAGVVAAVGSNGGSFREGDRVWALSRLTCSSCPYCLTGRENLCDRGQLFGVELPGGYAEFIKVPLAALRSLPSNVSYELGAAFQIAFGTGWHSLVTLARLQPGQSVLIDSAGSGVGSAALQVTRLVGATVFAAAGSDEKLEKAKRYGADHVINASRKDFVEYVMSATGGQGVDVVMENAGGEEFTRSLQCVRKGGVVVVVGAHAGELVQMDLVHIFRRELRVVGSRNAKAAELTTIMDLVARGRLSPVVHCALPLSQAREAHDILASRSAFGKVLLIP